ncbi:transporter [Streptomyces macrosporus]|uniref:Uncharacterized protein n=1 Tax=Streptomyces macrosporus TaxID=44032 RepID=A0ABP5XI31_9ACTN
MNSTARTRASRGTDALVAVLLFLLDAALVGVLLYLTAVSYGFDVVPDREAAAGMAGKAAVACAVGAVVTAVPAARARAWIVFTVQAVALGGSTLFFVLLAVR